MTNLGSRCLLAAFLLLVAAALQASGLEPHPLAPPDRSSPRATLQNFIEQMDAAQAAYAERDNGEGIA